ncbi:MAG: hypothetical protein R3B84_24410 [Zavarzinella sp.]
MKSDILRELASQMTAGESLSSADEVALLEQLHHPSKREAILADEAVDTLLRAAVHISATSDDFLAATLARAEAILAEQLVFPVTPNHRASSVRTPRLRRWLIRATCAAAVLLAVVLWGSPPRGNDGKPKSPPEITQHNLNQPIEKPTLPLQPKVKPPVGPVVKPPAVPDNRFVRLVKSENAVWETPIRDGDRMERGTLKLTQGTAELVFDKGTVAKMTGPVELDLRNGNEVYLRKGSLSAQVPAGAVGFTVRTPLSRVVDRGSEFDVRVGKRGETDAVVRRGRVAFTPQREGERASKTLELIAGELERANVSLPDVSEKLLPLSTKATGTKGQFMGLVSVDGKTGVFSTNESFQKFESAVHRQLRQSSEQFNRTWSLNVQVFGRGSMAMAMIVINGERYQIEVYGDDGDSKR